MRVSFSEEGSAGGKDAAASGPEADPLFVRVWERDAHRTVVGSEKEFDRRLLGGIRRCEFHRSDVEPKRSNFRIDTSRDREIPGRLDDAGIRQPFTEGFDTTGKDAIGADTSFDAVLHTIQ